MDHQKLNLSGIKQEHNRIVSYCKYIIYKNLSRAKHRLYKLMSVKNSHFWQQKRPILPRSRKLTYKGLSVITHRIYRVMAYLFILTPYNAVYAVSYYTVKAANGVF